MQFRLPDFRDQSLQELSVCAMFELGNGQSDPRIGEPVQFQAALSAPEGTTAWIRIQIDRKPDCGHVHCDIGRSYSQLKGVEVVPIQDAFDRLAPFDGQRATMAVLALYSIGVAELPPYGVIATMMDVTTASCGYGMSVDGASMAISGGDFSRMKWERSKSGDRVSVQLYQTCEADIDCSYLVELSGVMRGGVDCFVFEVGDSWIPSTSQFGDEHDDELRNAAEA